MMAGLIVKVGFLLVLMVFMVKGQYVDDTDAAEELKAIANLLSQPENAKYDLHRKALENEFEKFLDFIQEAEEEYADYNGIDDEKRSIATLAKNGQLPSREPDTDIESIGDDDNGHKRNIGSVLRTGRLGGKRNIQSLARQWQFASPKRNYASLIRNNMLPGGGKRTIASLARNGFGKRNVATLARDWALPKLNSAKFDSDGKRNIQSMKNSISHGRKKREIGDSEIPEPVMQNGPLDYEELLQSFNDLPLPYMYQNSAEKRFLGRILLPTRASATTRHRRL